MGFVIKVRSEDFQTSQFLYTSNSTSKIRFSSWSVFVLEVKIEKQDLRIFKIINVLNENNKSKKQGFIQKMKEKNKSNYILSLVLIP